MTSDDRICAIGWTDHARESRNSNRNRKYAVHTVHFWRKHVLSFHFESCFCSHIDKVVSSESYSAQLLSHIEIPVDNISGRINVRHIVGNMWQAPLSHPQTVWLWVKWSTTSNLCSLSSSRHGYANQLPGMWWNHASYWFAEFQLAWWLEQAFSQQFQDSPILALSHVSRANKKNTVCEANSPRKKWALTIVFECRRFLVLRAQTSQEQYK